jgi:spore maturation protein CgeB
MYCPEGKKCLKSYKKKIKALMEFKRFRFKKSNDFQQQIKRLTAAAAFTARINQSGYRQAIGYSGTFYTLVISGNRLF